MCSVDARLRKFARADRDAVVELSRLAIARPELQVGNPVWTTTEELESEIADWSPPAEETLLVVEDGGEVVGLGGFELPRGFRHAELFGPLVATESRGHKLGVELLEHLRSRTLASAVPSRSSARSGRATMPGASCSSAPDFASRAVPRRPSG